LTEDFEHTIEAEKSNLCFLTYKKTTSAVN